MRYVVGDERAVSLDEIGRALAAVDKRYRLQHADNTGTLSHGATLIAQVEVNVPGDGLFDEERDELIEFAEDAEGGGKQRVLEMLRGARALVAAQVLFGTGETESTLQLLDPLWHWLSEHRRGLLQADGEGYYDGADLVLEVE